MISQLHVDLFCTYLREFNIDPSSLHINTSFSFSDCHHIKSIYDLVASANGDFYIKYTIDRHDYLITSSACTGIYFDCQNGITPYKNEKSAYLSLVNYNSKIQLNSTELHSSLIAHQLCWNSPISSFVESIYYCPANTAIELTHNNSSFSLKPLSLLISEDLLSHLHSSSLEDCIQDVTNTHYRKSSNFILFSGGLDSSLICSAFTHLSVHFHSFYKRYNESLFKAKQLVHPCVRSVESFLGINLSIIDQYSNINYSKLIHLMETSPRAIIKAKYLSYLPDSICEYISDNYSELDKVLISGQNVDTLASLDTFAPETTIQYPLRLLFNLKASFKRLRLLLQIYCIKLFSNSLTKSRPANLASISEHVHKSSSPIDNISASYSSSFYRDRSNRFDITTIFDQHILGLFSLKSSGYKLKILRFYRTIQNSQRLFGDFFVMYGIRKDMLFMNGLLFQKMLLLPIKPFNIFYPKKAIYQAFIFFSKVPFRSLLAPNSLKTFVRTLLQSWNAYLGHEQKSLYDIYPDLINLFKDVNLTHPFSASPFLSGKYVADKYSTIYLLAYEFNTISQLNTKEIRFKLLLDLYGPDVICRFLNLHVYFSSLFMSGEPL